MKNLFTRRFCLICKFLCVPFLTNAQVQVFHYADSIYQSGNYPLAEVEYQRIIFENTNPEIQANASLKAATCLKKQNKYTAAAATLNEINIFKISDTLRYRVLFQSGLNAYLAHNAHYAISALQQLSHYYADSANNQDVLLLKILSFNGLRSWHQADSLYNLFMLSYFQGNKIPPNPYLNIPKLKDPGKAERLSAYLPFTAAGIFYAGNIREGLLNAGLQVGFIAFAVYNVLLGKYITAALIGVGGYAAFYKGGTRRAKRLAELYNERKIKAFNTKIKKQLIGVVKSRKH